MTLSADAERRVKENADENNKRQLRNWAIVGVVVLVLGAVAANLPSSEERCVERGIAYFKEIGSWPTLTTGRDAETVAKERCSRTTGAFK